MRLFMANSTIYTHIVWTSKKLMAVIVCLDEHMCDFASATHTGTQLLS